MAYGEERSRAPRPSAAAAGRQASGRQQESAAWAQRGYRDPGEDDDGRALRDPELENGHRRYDRDYSEEEAVVVDRAKAIHRETTASTSRALRSVQQTRELAANTVEELGKQGEKLDSIDRDLQEIDTDVQEGRSLLRFMNRCCCCFLFSCCCGGCDPDQLRDKTRKQRVAARKTVRAHEQQMVLQSRERAEATPADDRALAAQVSRVTDDDARGELFEGSPGAGAGPGSRGGGGSSSAATAAERARERRNRARGGAYRIGEGLADRDRDAIYEDTVQQEQNLDEIDAALGDIKQYSEAMGAELARQHHKVEHLQNHVEDAGENISNVATKTKKDFRLRGKGLQPTFQAPSALKVAHSVHKALR